MQKPSTVLLTGALAIGAAVVVAPHLAAAAPKGGPTITGTWAKRVPADPNKGKPTALTCRSETFCVLADTYGAILVEQNGRWRASYQLDPSLLVTDVSCVSERSVSRPGRTGRRTRAS